MDHRSPARFLAPLALVGVILALFLVVKASRNDGSSSSGAARTTSTASPRTHTGAGQKTRPKGTPRAATYRVKPGDTLQAIAAKTGLSLPVLRQLNPAVNPAALVVGQIIKLKG